MLVAPAHSHSLDETQLRRYSLYLEFELENFSGECVEALYFLMGDPGSLQFR